MSNTVAELEKDTKSDITDKPEIFHVYLSKKELELIFKWYDKGYTHADSDRPLYDKLIKVHQGR